MEKSGITGNKCLYLRCKKQLYISAAVFLRLIRVLKDLGTLFNAVHDKNAFRLTDPFNF